MKNRCTPMPEGPILAQVVEPAEAAVVLAEVVTDGAPILALAVLPAAAEATLVVPLAAAPATPVGFHPLAFLARVWRGFCSACEWTFGAVTLLAGLAVLAVIPLAQFLCLGYLLEVSGRIARTGRLRDGFIGMRKAARVGTIVLSVWLLLLPLRFLSSLAFSAEIVEPGGQAATGLRLALFGLTIALVLHIGAACSRGGKFRHFFWPFTNPIWLARRLGRGGYWAEARDAVWTFVASLRLPYYFWLGLRGFLGGFLWLAVPATLIWLGRLSTLVGYLGAFLLMFVVLYVPFLQIRLVLENRFRALFEVRAVRAHFRRAPWAFALALFFTLLLAVPLYLLKITVVPRDAAWLPSIFFVVFVLPARMLAGWAYSRSRRRQQSRHWFFRWTGRLSLVPVVAAYVALIWVGHWITWDGIGAFYAQHAFLVPAPLTGL